MVRSILSKVGTEAVETLRILKNGVLIGTRKKAPTISDAVSKCVRNPELSSLHVYADSIFAAHPNNVQNVIKNVYGTRSTKPTQTGNLFTNAGFRRFNNGDIYEFVRYDEQNGTNVLQAQISRDGKILKRLKKFFNEQGKALCKETFDYTAEDKKNFYKFTRC